VNESKFQLFELFRRNAHHPEILAFDELLERARFIVDHPPKSGTACGEEPLPFPPDDEDEILF
jgi:hypothetical protein